MFFLFFILHLHRKPLNTRSSHVNKSFKKQQRAVTCSLLPELSPPSSNLLLAARLAYPHWMRNSHRLNSSNCLVSHWREHYETVRSFNQFLDTNYPITFPRPLPLSVLWNYTRRNVLFSPARSGNEATVAADLCTPTLLNFVVSGWAQRGNM